MGCQPTPGYAAVLLAGGAGTRLGGVTKPLAVVDGVALIVRVLDAVPDATPRIVVGPPELLPVLPNGVALTREQPAGGGPVAGLAAGLALIPTETETDTDTGASAEADTVAVLAADLPFLTPAAVRELRHGLAADDDADGAVFVDESGRHQWLCGVWRVDALRQRLASLGDPSGRGMREVCQALTVVAVAGDGLRSWFDCDTTEDLREAEAVLRRDTDRAPRH